MLALSFLVFLAVVPFAKIQLPAAWAFLPIYQSAYIVVTLVTAAILFGQFHLRHSLGLLILAGGYLFDAFMAIAHALSFPGLFAPGGLLGAGPQTTAWIYFLWHGGFPLFLIAYALVGDGKYDLRPAGKGNRAAVIATLGGILVLVAALTTLTTAGHDLLPQIVAGNTDAPGKALVAMVCWALCFAALLALWLRRPRSLFNLWLMVVTYSWIFDIALAAVFNHGRFDLGWYAGRLYGLSAGSFVLIVLLFENSKLYEQLSRMREEEYQDSRKQLMTSEARFEATFDHAAVGIALLAPDGRWLRVNRQLCRITGYGVEELLAKTFQEIAHPDDLAADLGYTHQMLARERESYSMENRFIGKDGSVVWVNLSVTLSWTQDGKPDFFIAIIEDISERKRAEALLVRTQEELQSELADTKLLHEISLSLIHQDQVKDLYEKIMDAASAIMDSEFASLQMLFPGRGSGGELLLLAYRGFTPEAGQFWAWVRADSKSTCGLALKTGKREIATDVASCEFMDGSEDRETYLQTGIRAVQTTPLFSRAGKLVGMLSTHWKEPHHPTERDLRLLDILARQAADLLESKMAEAAIQAFNASLEDRVRRRTAELETANRELEAFTFATSHDLRGPLGRINSFSILLEKRYRDRLEGDGLEFLQFIRDNSTRLLHLVDDLLSHARIAQHTLELQGVDVLALTRTVLQERVGDIIKAGIEAHLDVAPAQVMCDPQVFGQGLGNVIENALKYSAQAEQPAIEIGGRVVEGKYHLWVKDNGIGFDMRYHDKIFGMFQRLHTHSEYQGSGIGLALVKRAMERMGGKVWAESEPGKGATFFLELQLDDGRTDGSEPGQVMEDVHPMAKVLGVNPSR